MRGAEEDRCRSTARVGPPRVGTSKVSGKLSDSGSRLRYPDFDPR